MKSAEFDSFCAGLRPGIPIELSNFNLTQFWHLIQALLNKGLLNHVQLSRKFSDKENRILVNEYVIACYNNDIFTIEQCIKYAELHNLSLDRKFCYFVYDGNPGYYAYLEGYDYEEVTKQDVVDYIVYYLQNLEKCLFEAIETNKLRDLRIAICCGAQVNQKFNQQYPTEYAIRLDRRQALSILLCEGGADRAVAFQKMCEIGATQHIFNIITNDQSFKATDWEIATGLINYDRIELLAQFMCQDAVKIRIKGKVNFIRSLYQYSKNLNEIFGKAPKTEKYLKNLADIENQRLKKIHSAIKDNDLSEFISLLQTGLSANQEYNGRYILSLVCEHGRGEMLRKLLTDKELRLTWYKYETTVSDDYDDGLDPILLSIHYDKPETLVVALEVIDGKVAYRHHTRYLQAIEALAAKDGRKEILAKLHHIEEMRQRDIRQLFTDAASNNKEGIDSALKKGVDLNACLDGTSLLHILCEHEHHLTFQHLLATKSLDLDLKNQDGDYVLTIAANNGNLEFIRSLINVQHFKWLKPWQAKDFNYDPKKDPIFCAITKNNLNIVDYLLRFLFRQDYAEISLPNLNCLLQLAETHNAQSVKGRISEYIRALKQGDQVFKGDLDKQLQEIIESAQSIVRIEISAISSIISLCNYLGITIEKTKEGMSLKSKAHDFDKIFSTLKPAIERSKNKNYKIYPTKNHAGILITDTKYQEWALQMYNSIADGKPGKYGSYDVYRTFWFDKDEKVISGAGLLVKEVWCLAILAAQDPFGLEDVFLDETAIEHRMQQIVEALVHCWRAYNLNNFEYKDDGNPISDYSCVHGVSLRPLIFLSGMHKCINIRTNPLEWAYSIAREEITRLFTQDRDRCAQLSAMLLDADFQKKYVKNSALLKFYNDAVIVIRARLDKEVGLIKKGGALLQKEMDDIIAAIPYLPLPLHVPMELDDALVFPADFVQIQGCAINYDTHAYEQYKLPDTPDAFYLAILISARDMELPPHNYLASVTSLREKIAEILQLTLVDRYILTQSIEEQMDEQKIRDIEAERKKLLIKEMPNPCTMPAIEAIFTAKHHDADLEFRNAYIRAVGDSATVDRLTLTIIAGLLGRKIRVFNLHGAHMLDINAQTLFVYTDPGLPLLNVCVHVTDNGNNKKYNYNFTNAVVRKGNWDRLQDFAHQVGNKTVSQQLDLDMGNSHDYQVMLGRNIADKLQIKIPGDGNCLFHAAWLGARTLGIPHALDMDDSSVLRILVQDGLRSLLSEGRAAPLGEGNSNLIIDSFKDAINDFNEINGGDKIVASPEEYVQVMGQPGAWGGQLELHLLTKILQVNFVLYQVNKIKPINIVHPDGNATIPTIYLFRTINHYNLLVDHWPPTVGLPVAPIIIKDNKRQAEKEPERPKGMIKRIANRMGM